MTVTRRIIAAAVCAPLLCALLFNTGMAQAQNPVAAPSAIPAISGSTLEKKAFNLAALKGKVVLVMFWSTDCSVCRDKMPELRENVQGWADKPFEVVLISGDRRFADVESYNTILRKLVPINSISISIVP